MKSIFYKKTNTLMFLSVIEMISDMFHSSPLSELRSYQIVQTSLKF